MDKHQAAELFAKNPALAKQAEDVMRSMLSRSATDRGFRTQLLADPRATVAEFIGRPAEELPAEWNVKFIENQGDATLVLPDFVDPNAELSAEELEAVAGGSEPVSTTAIALWALAGGLAGASVYLATH